MRSGMFTALALQLVMPMVAPDPARPPVVAQGAHHACALLANHWVVCWGANDWGPLAAPSLARSPAAHLVDGIPPARAIATGELGSCIVAIDGAIWCWGGMQEPAEDTIALVRHTPVRLGARAHDGALCMVRDEVRWQDEAGDIVSDNGFDRRVLATKMPPLAQLTCSRNLAMAPSGEGIARRYSPDSPDEVRILDVHWTWARIEPPPAKRVSAPEAPCAEVGYTTTWFVRDHRGRVERVLETNDVETRESASRTYDGQGRLVEERSCGDEGSPFERTVFRYDRAGRLEQSTRTRDTGGSRPGEIITTPHYDGDVEVGQTEVRYGDGLFSGSVIAVERATLAGAVQTRANVAGRFYRGSLSAHGRETREAYRNVIDLDPPVSMGLRTEDQSVYDDAGRKVRVRRWVAMRSSSFGDSDTVEDERFTWDGPYLVMRATLASDGTPTGEVTRYRYDGCRDRPPVTRRCEPYRVP